MKMSLKLLPGIFLALICLSGLSGQAWAQNGRKQEADRAIRNLEGSMDVFVRLFDKSLDNSRLNGTRREDNLNKRARDLESATNQLRREFNRRDSWAENKGDVRKCLNLASEIDRVIARRRLGDATETTWADVRRDLNALAALYNLPNIRGR
jgi:hypothetical protein